MQLPRRAFWPWLVIAALAILPFFWVVQRPAVAWSPGAWLSARQNAELAAVLAARNANPHVLPDDVYLFVALLAATGGYLLMLRQIHHVQAARGHFVALFVGTFVLSSALWFVPNLLSGDVYSYVMYGRMALLHGGNPFLQTPSEFATDPFLRWVTWQDQISIYGPVWVWISAAVVWFAELLGGSLGTYVFIYKALATSAHLVGGACIVGILSMIAPKQRLFGAALYLLNPLTLIEFSMNGHNDAVMLLCILSGIYLALRKGGQAEFLSALAFAAAFFTKWSAGGALLLFGVRALRAGATWRARLRTLGFFVAAVLIAGLTYLPFWQGMKTLETVHYTVPVRRSINSLGDEVLRQRFQQIHPAGKSLGALTEDEAGRLILLHNALWVASNVLVLLGLLVGVIATALGRGAAQAAVGWVFMLFCATTLWFWPWYATWALALGAVSSWRGLGKNALVFSLCAPLAYVLRATPHSGIFAVGLPVAWVICDRLYSLRTRANDPSAQA